jgi:hypothetical protein
MLPEHGRYMLGQVWTFCRRYEWLQWLTVDTYKSTRVWATEDNMSSDLYLLSIDLADWPVRGTTSAILPVLRPSFVQICLVSSGVF